MKPFMKYYMKAFMNKAGEREKRVKKQSKFMSPNECDRDDKGKCRRKLKRGMELKCNIALTHASEAVEV